MENDKKIALLEDLFEIEEGTLKPETLLDDIEAWDSITRLSLIVMIDDNFGKTLREDDFKNLHTVKDILNCMEWL